MRFAGGDFLGRAPHVIHHQADQCREAGERHEHEGQHTPDNLAAEPGWFPGKPRNRATLRICHGDDRHVVIVRPVVEQTQLGKLQPVADLAQHRVVDVFDSDDNRRAGIAGIDSASEPTATAATMAGRSVKRWIRTAMRLDRTRSGATAMERRRST